MFQLFILESATIDDFGDQMSINVDILRSLLIAVDTGDVGTIKSHGIGVDSSEEKDLVSRYAILFIYFYFIFHVYILGWIFCAKSFIGKAYYNWFSLK